MLWHTMVARIVAHSKGKDFRLLSDPSFYSSNIRKVHTSAGAGSSAATPNQNRPPTRVGTAGPHGAVFRSTTNLVEKSKEEEHEFAQARRINLLGKYTYVVAVILFNIVFWSVAFSEYFRPAEEYI